MKIIEPNVELLEQTDLISHVARCARICYRKETGDDEKLYNSLITRNHLSMFRHISHYYIISRHNAPRWLVSYFDAILKGAKIIGIDINYVQENYYVVTNGNWDLDHIHLLMGINDYMITAKEFANANEVAWNMMRYTFKVITQISTSRELNRVSPNNIAEQSTRYVYEDGTICRPHWLEGYKISQGLRGGLYIYKDENTEIEMDNKVRLYIEDCERSFNNYKYLIDSGIPRQDARGVLPLDTATHCVYTYSIDEWRAIIDLRYYGTTGKPHPNAKIITGMIREKLIELGYEFR